jgi:hypothetical protein
MKRWLDFKDAAILIDKSSRSFRAEFVSGIPTEPFGSFEGIGRFHLSRGYLFTTFVVVRKISARDRRL